MDIIVKKKMMIGITVIVLLISGYYFFFGQAEPKQPEPIFSELKNSTKEDNSNTNEKNKTPTIIKVDVKGAVRTPGVFVAKPGDRVIDLIAAAGDFKKEADLNKVNLAQLVEDQMVIYVPKIGEKVEPPGSINGSSGETVSAVGINTSGKEGMVNLNTASQAELETLPGIGPSKALAIMDYRETTGNFQKIEDLKNISGIGDKTFEKLKDSITVN